MTASTPVGPWDAPDASGPDACVCADGFWRPERSVEAQDLSEDAIVVDTRSAADFKKSHILNAKHVPMAGIEERAKEISKNTDRTIICYCGIGNVAPQAAAKLRKLGYTRAYALKGGINAWQGDGMPVTSK